MKRTLLFFSALLFAVTLSAQHVTPLNVKLTDFSLDELRSMYQGSSYLLELQRLEKLMKDDTKALKDAQIQLKSEKDYYKQTSAYIDKADASFKTLLVYSQKELDEFNKLKAMLDKQINAVNSNNELSSETRSKAIEDLQAQRRALEAMLTATTKRQSQMAEHPTQLQQMRTNLLVFSSEITNKETDIKQLETTLQTNRNIIKEEIKNVKSQKK